MRRRLLLGILALAAAAAVAATVAAGSGAGGGTDTYRVDAIFDNASFLIPGEDVKIAGARVGRVADVTLTADRKARVEMEVDPRFAPFRSDADCTIQPQSLLGEKFVQCVPGTPAGRPLRAPPGDVPTLPVENTHSPVDLDLVFATFRRPTPERLALLLNELGAGLAGRGDDLNALIRRANPALQETNRVLAILNRDRRRLQSLIGASDRILGAVAAKRERVAQFVAQSDRALRATARRRKQLGATVRGLPPLLAQAEPALAELRRLEEEATPLVRDVRRAAPQLRRFAANAGPLVAAARPARGALGRAADAGEPALRAATPVARQLRTFAAGALPAARLVDQLFRSLRDRGAVEGLHAFAYNGALAVSRFDRWSHILPAHLMFTACAFYAREPVEGCDAHLSPAARAAEPRSARGRPQRRASRPARRVAPPAHERESRRGEQPPARAHRRLVPRLPVPPSEQPAEPPLRRLLDYLLGG